MGLVARRHLHHAAVGALLAVALLLSAVAVPGATAQDETDDEHEFSYDPAAENGPDGWGEIKPEWATCSNGRWQSPINLTPHHVRRDLGYLNYSYQPAEASVVNRGHDIMVSFKGDAGSLTIDGTVYHLKQLHWHSPTEHALYSRRHAMELHMVHQTAEKKTAVVGILYRVSNNVADPFIRILEPAIKRLAAGGRDEEPIGKVNPNDVGLTGSSYFRYTGSLTTPPCAEGIVWTVIPTLRLVTLYQLDLLRQAVDDGFQMNARPLQELNHRVIWLQVQPQVSAE